MLTVTFWVDNVILSHLTVEETEVQEVQLHLYKYS